MDRPDHPIRSRGLFFSPVDPEGRSKPSSTRATSPSTGARCTVTTPRRNGHATPLLLRMPSLFSHFRSLSGLKRILFPTKFIEEFTICKNCVNLFEKLK